MALNYIDIFPNINPTAPYGDGKYIYNPILSIAATRLFKFTFNTPSTLAVAEAEFVFSNSTISTDENIHGIYETGDNINLTANATTFASGFSLHSSGNILLGAVSTPTVAFKVTGINPNKEYSIITKTRWNDTNDGKLLAIRIDGQAVPLNYVATYSAAAPSEILADAWYKNQPVLLDNLIRATNPDNSAFSVPGGLVNTTRFFAFEFTATSETLTAIGENFSTFYSIIGLHDVNNPLLAMQTATYIKNLSSSVTLVAQTTSAPAIINISAFSTQSAGGKLFEIQGLTVGRTYRLITRNTSTSVPSSTIFSNLKLALFDSSNQRVTLSYVKAGMALAMGNVYPGTAMIPDIQPFAEILPSTNPKKYYGNGAPLDDPRGGDAGLRYFQFIFTPTSTNVDIYNNTAFPSSTLVIGIFKSTDMVNALDGTYEKALSSSQIGIKRFALTGLEVNQEYTIVTRTTSNSVSSNEIMFVAIDSSLQEIPITYVRTGLLLQNQVYQNLSSSYVIKTINLAPNFTPSGVPLVDPAVNITSDRFYRFIFTAPPAPDGQTTSSLLVRSYTGTDATNTGYLSIVNIAKSSTPSINIVPQVSLRVGAILSVDQQTISFNLSPSTSNEAFLINNLEPEQEYQIISKTILNAGSGSLGTSLQGAIFFDDDRSLEYVATSNTYVNGQLYNITIPWAELQKNKYPEAPNGNGRPIESRHYLILHEFTANRSNYDVLIKTASAVFFGTVATTTHNITGLYRQDDELNQNVLSTSIENFQNGTTFSENKLGFGSNKYGIGFSLKSLEVGKKYSLISFVNYSNFISSTYECSIALQYPGEPANFEVLTYKKAGVIQLGNSIYGDATNLVPNIYPNPLNTAAAGTGTFYFSFTANSTSADLYFYSNGTSTNEERILYIGEAYNFNNYIDTSTDGNPNLSIVNTGVVVKSNGILIIPNSTPGYSYGAVLNNLVPNKTYVIAIVTTYNDTQSTQADVAISVFNSSIKESMPLNYVGIKAGATTADFKPLTRLSTVITRTSPIANQINLNWAPSIYSNILGYNVFYRKNTESTYTKVSNSSIYSTTSTSITIPGLVGNTVYKFKFAEVFSDGEMSQTFLAFVKQDGTITFAEEGILITSITAPPEVWYGTEINLGLLQQSVPFILGIDPVYIYNNYEFLRYDPITNEIIQGSSTGVSGKYRLEEGSTTTYVAYSDTWNLNPSPINNIRITTSSTADPTGRANWYNLVPNIDKSGNSIVATEGAKQTERYFRHSFNSGTNNLLNLFFKTNNTSSTEERILGLYKSGQRSNLLKQGSTEFTITSGLNYLTGSNSILLLENQLENNTANIPNATITVTGNNITYYLIVKTTYNDDTNEDINIAIENTSGANIDLTYESTQLSNYNVYEASGAPMTIIGGSIKDKNEIRAQEARISGLETNVAGKVLTQTYNNKVSELETAINERVVQSTYDAKIPLIESEITGIKTRETTLESRYTSLEGQVAAVNTDISSRVDVALGNKVSQTTFDALETELKTADSGITTALALLVVAETQLTVDTTQDTAIASKLSSTTYTQKMSAIDAKNLLQDALIANLTNPSDFTAKVQAVEEYIQMFLASYDITLPDGSQYEYTGNYQSIV